MVRLKSRVPVLFLALVGLLIGLADLVITSGCSSVHGTILTSAGRGCFETNTSGGWTLPRIGASGFVNAQASYTIGLFFNPTLLIGAEVGASALAGGTASKTLSSAANITRQAANSAIGFAEGLGKTALTPGRLQHGTNHLTKAGVLPAWSGKHSPGIIERALVPILERPTATFDHTLDGTRVRGFLGDIDGNQAALFVYKEGPYQGQLASSFVPSANQLKVWGLP